MISPAGSALPRGMAGPRPAAGGAVEPISEAPPQPLDLNSVQLNPAPAEERSWLRSAGRVFTRFGLSAALGSVLGPVGVALGAAVGGLQAGLSQGPRTGLLVAAASACVGGVAVALGPVAGGVLSLGALALGAWHGSRVRSGDDPRDAEATREFANAYLEETRAALKGPEVKDPEAVKKLPGAVKRGNSKKAMEAQAAQAIYQACQLASGNLPAAVALDLSTRAAGRLLGPAQLEKLEEKLLAGMPARGEQPAEGEGPVRIRYAELGEMGPAAAAVNTVVLDPAFVKGKDPVTVDFVMGHEFSHVRHKDVVAKLGFMAFSSSLNLLARQEPNLSQQLAIALMLQALGAQKSREIEFRCDREGVDFALSRGHSPEAVASAAEALFRQEKERGSTASATPLDTHPPNEERVRAIRQHLFPG